MTFPSVLTVAWRRGRSHGRMRGVKEKGACGLATVDSAVRKSRGDCLGECHHPRLSTMIVGKASFGFSRMTPTSWISDRARDRTPPADRPPVAGVRVLLIVAACVVMAVAWTLMFASVRGNGTVLAFIILTLYLLSSLFFQWGEPRAARAPSNPARPGVRSRGSTKTRFTCRGDGRRKQVAALLSRQTV